MRGDNLAAAGARGVPRARRRRLPPLELRIDKRIPVAAGLGGGSADAAAALRIANEIAGRPLGRGELRGSRPASASDVPSQVDPRHALVTGVGERVEPLGAAGARAGARAGSGRALHRRPSMRELDRIGGSAASGSTPSRCAPLAAAPARRRSRPPSRTTSSRRRSRCGPSSRRALDALRDAGALGAAVSGSGPTCFGLFEDARAAEEAAASIPARARGTELR